MHAVGVLISRVNLTADEPSWWSVTRNSSTRGWLPRRRRRRPHTDNLGWTLIRSHPDSGLLSVLTRFLPINFSFSVRHTATDEENHFFTVYWYIWLQKSCKLQWMAEIGSRIFLSKQTGPNTWYSWRFSVVGKCLKMCRFKFIYTLHFSVVYLPFRSFIRKSRKTKKMVDWQREGKVRYKVWICIAPLSQGL